MDIIFVLAEHTVYFGLEATCVPAEGQSMITKKENLAHLAAPVTYHIKYTCLSLESLTNRPWKSFQRRG